MILPGILLGVVLGALLGYFVSDFMLAVSIIGELFYNALLILVLPLVLAAVINGVTSLGDYHKLGRVGGKTLWYFLITGLVAVVLAVAVSLVNFGLGSSPVSNLYQNLAGTSSPYLNYSRLMNAGDSSLFGELFSNIQYLSLVLLVVVFGGILSIFGPRKNRNLTSFFRDVNESLIKLFEFLLYLSPLGVLSLVGTSVALARDNLTDMFGVLGVYLLVLTGTFLVYGLVVLPIIYRVVTSRSPFQFLAGMLPAIFTAFATGSSTANLGITYHGTVEHNHVDQRAGSLVLPLGTVFNVSATAMWLIISIITLIRMTPGMELTVIQIILVAVLSLLVSIGLAGVPRITIAAAMVIMSLSGFPELVLVGTGMLFMAEWITDRLRSSLNVWGDAIGAAVISETLEFKAVGRKTTVTITPRETRTRTPRKDHKLLRTDARKEDGRDRMRPNRTEQPYAQQKDTRSSRPGERVDKSGSYSSSGRAPETKRNGFGSPVKSPSSPFEFTESSLPELEPEFEGQQQRRSAPEKTPPVRGHRSEPYSSRSSSARTSQDRNRSQRPAPAVPKETVERKTDRKPKEDILDNEMFKKELARVSAHLHAIDKAKKDEEPTKPEAVSTPPETTVRENEFRKTPGAALEDTPVISTDNVTADLSTDEDTEVFDRRMEADEEVTETSITPKLNFLDRYQADEQAEYDRIEDFTEIEDAEGTGEELTPTTAENESAAVMEYGRSRYKKNVKSKAENTPEPAENNNNVPEPEDSFSNENISFGRSKKKRTR